MSELTKEQKIEKIKAANAKILAIINEEVMPHIEGDMHKVAQKLKKHQYTAYPFFCYESGGNDSKHRFVLYDEDVYKKLEL